MTDTGQIPGEGLPENAGGQQPEGRPDVPGSGGYSFADGSGDVQDAAQAHSAHVHHDPHANHQTHEPSEEEDLLLMPSAQGAWNEQPVPAPGQPAGQPQRESGYGYGYDPYGQPRQDAAPLPQDGGFPSGTEYGPDGNPAPYDATGADAYAAQHGYGPQEPPHQQEAQAAAQPVPAEEQAGVSGPEQGAHEADGRDSGAYDMSGVRAPQQPQPAPPATQSTSGSGPRRPLHLGPPVPEQSGTVRPLSERAAAQPAASAPQAAPVQGAPQPSAAGESRPAAEQQAGELPEAVPAVMDPQSTAPLAPEQSAAPQSGPAAPAAAQPGPQASPEPQQPQQSGAEQPVPEAGAPAAPAATAQDPAPQPDQSAPSPEEPLPGPQLGQLPPQQDDRAPQQPVPAEAAAPASADESAPASAEESAPGAPAAPTAQGPVADAGAPTPPEEQADDTAQHPAPPHGAPAVSGPAPAAAVAPGPEPEGEAPGQDSPVNDTVPGPRREAQPGEAPTVPAQGGEPVPQQEAAVPPSTAPPINQDPEPAGPRPDSPVIPEQATAPDSPGTVASEAQPGKEPEPMPAPEATAPGTAADPHADAAENAAAAHEATVPAPAAEEVAAHDAGAAPAAAAGGAEPQPPAEPTAEAPDAVVDHSATAAEPDQEPAGEPAPSAAPEPLGPPAGDADPAGGGAAAESVPEDGAPATDPAAAGQHAVGTSPAGPGTESPDLSDGAAGPADGPSAEAADSGAASGPPPSDEAAAGTTGVAAPAPETAPAGTGPAAAPGFQPEAPAGTPDEAPAADAGTAPGPVGAPEAAGQPVPDTAAVDPAPDGESTVDRPGSEGSGSETPDGPPAEATPEGGAAHEEPAAAAPAGEPAPGFAEAEREAVHRLMRERRDIRNGFRPDPIPHEVLLRVLEAAHTAPSVGHSQPWDFVVIRSEETRRAMHELAERQRQAYAKSLPKARAKQFKQMKIEAILDTPVNIVVTADPTRGGRHTLGRHTQPQMAPYSSALAVENLWLAARAEGLGVGWVSFFDEREMVRALELPEHLEVVAYLCVGYVDEFPGEPELMQAGWSKRRPLSWVVHEESYGRRALPGAEPTGMLAETLSTIRPLDAKALGEAWERQKRMTKPSGALGMLEIISAQLCGLSRKCPPPVPEPAAVAVFAGDHGVHQQGVTPWPQEVTAQMVANFLGGGAVCNAFANQVGAEVCVVDVGVAAELPTTPGLLPRKVRAGTADMTAGPALTQEEVERALEVGIETARDLVAAGNKALLTGEMGIANTTASAALIAACTGADPAEITGRGTGINDETHARKVEVVRRALELHQPDPADPLGMLSAFGGLEHAAMVGLILGGASLRTPVILDGVSAGAAALVARAVAPEALAACIAGHRSAEPGHVAALTKLGLRPLLDLDLRLGEGTGALLALPMVQSAARAMHEVATFDAAGVTEKS
ncbi:nicotinate-nucleotide--dimethylbenzimidazole phosphoribosyltransferase [Streptomyces sp. WMMB303]|uniref:nicotinate-nucleotide--dimethylbenzimidazole phosphoribosyltransferase n=1 Tax=Streptomyces sp. WMMB303 TaxID=3034154 RepID=UPI0023EC1555|nr:nicotinate-nucleotide--dimethylbenzimidazole phosphoribosyltransferase [Streptomyces sp. WMMB303]MDF4249431.1 nicotinate-nucleotide--dimethylbenzimidazole phosphoribosyltransferase [Streptomyces sp. WMMB303]